MDKRKNLRRLGVVTKGEKAFIFYNFLHHHKNLFHVETSENGVDFKKYHKNPEIKDKTGAPKQIEECSDFRISEFKNQYILIYKYHSKNEKCLFSAVSSDLIHWEDVTKISNISEVGMLIPHYLYKGNYIMYFGENAIKIASSYNLKLWEILDEKVVVPKEDHLGLPKFKIGNLIKTQDGILLIYFVYYDQIKEYTIHSALFDKNDPSKLLWQSDEPIWEQSSRWQGKVVDPIGIVNIGDKLISYWELQGEGIFAVTHSLYKQIEDILVKHPTPLLHKFINNPIIKPIVKHFWESKATFNPAATYEDGKVHLVYRAVGDNDTSVLGYAASKDGIHIDERSDKPVYIPSQPFEYNGKGPVVCPSGYTSGGGYGGCEDPRLTKIDDKFYLTYVAFDGSNPPRVALNSINVEDFLVKKWNWNKSVLISPPGVVDKNAVIFPEKLLGKYVIFHRIYPNILIDFVDNLDFDGNTFLQGQYMIQPRKTSWDSRKIGAGPPPIKTDRGWLLIYHTVGEQDPSKYKIGAMLLDLKDPRCVIARANRPILEPNQWYENEGYKSGVAYPCGAVTFNNYLYVYYGGADQVVCVAYIKLNEFLNKLNYSKISKFEKIKVRGDY